MKNLSGSRSGPAEARPTLVAGLCLVAAVSLSAPALAQEGNASNDPPAPSAATQADPEDSTRIVVIGQRIIVAPLEDVPIEREIDEAEAVSYGASTVGGFLGELSDENGDEDPAVLVNGQPVRDLGDVADLPVEAIEKVEQLPRGAAARIGGSPGQRAYNVVLKPSVKSVTATASREVATEGDWGQTKLEALATYIKDKNRLNLTLRRTNSDLLFEADRGITPRPQFYAYSVDGNVLPAPGSVEVDPALSALAGQTVTSVALPGGSALNAADLLAGANRPNPSSASLYRSIRSASERYEAALAGNVQFAEWLSLSLNGRLTWSDSESLRGLPTGRFLIPASNNFTPFSAPVILALQDPARPLKNLNDSDTQSLSSTFNAIFGRWTVSLLGSYDYRKSIFDSQLNGRFAGGYFVVDDAVDPFASDLASLIPITDRRTESRTRDRRIALDAQGPLFELPAGSAMLRLGTGGLWSSFEGNGITGKLSTSRRELSYKAGLTLPVTGGEFLSGVGSTQIDLEIGRIDVGRFGKIGRYSIAFEWNPISWLQLSASQFRDGSVIYPELLAAPIYIIDNVPYFDPIRTETVDVQLITGGASNLRNEKERTRSLSLTARPPSRYQLQASVEYRENVLRDQLGFLPEPSSAVVQAFPDRFVRDAGGTLISVDTSAINFERETSDEFRINLGATLPISDARTIQADGDRSRRRVPATRLRLNLAYTHILNSDLLIRSGLPAVDLLDGGAIGVRGGKLRDNLSASLALTRGFTGVRLNTTYRGTSYLRTGTSTSPDKLTFSPLWKTDIRLYADLSQLAPQSSLASGTRVSVSVENIFNKRQRVSDLSGQTPLAYQPGYRDPVGRTITFELRKAF